MVAGAILYSYDTAIAKLVCRPIPLGERHQVSQESEGGTGRAMCQHAFNTMTHGFLLPDDLANHWSLYFLPEMPATLPVFHRCFEFELGVLVLR